MFMKNTADLDLATENAFGGPVHLCPFVALSWIGPFGPSRVKALEILKPACEYLDGVESNVQIIVRRGAA